MQSCGRSLFFHSTGLVAAAALVLGASTSDATPLLQTEEAPPLPAAEEPVAATTPTPVVQHAEPPPAPGETTPSPVVATQAEPPPPPEQQPEEEEEDEDHHGFFFRLTLGAGYASIAGTGTFNPMAGLRRIEDPAHHAPALNLALDLGGGLYNLAIHVGTLMERMLLRADDPTEIGFTLFGIGGGLSYYFVPPDLHLTLQVRYLGMLLFFPQVVCDSYYIDKFEWHRGPGVSLTVGKEWFGDNDGGYGLGLQGNYAYLTRDNMKFNYFSILLVLTLTHF